MVLCLVEDLRNSLPYSVSQFMSEDNRDGLQRPEKLSVAADSRCGLRSQTTLHARLPIGSPAAERCLSRFIKSGDGMKHIHMDFALLWLQLLLLLNNIHIIHYFFQIGTGSEPCIAENHPSFFVYVYENAGKDQWNERGKTKITPTIKRRSDTHLSQFWSYPSQLVIQLVYSL